MRFAASTVRDSVPHVRRFVEGNLAGGVYRRTTHDDVDTLRDLGLLLETDPLAGRHTPTSAPAGVLQALAAGLDALRGAPKGHLFRGASADVG